MNTSFTCCRWWTGVALALFSFGNIVAQTPCDLNPGAIICDNFETYTLGNVSPQSPWWKPWSGAENNALNGTVTTEQASDGSQSLKIQYEVAGTLVGDDQILVLGNKSTGRYELSWKMYIPSGHAAYYNMQNSETAGQQWNYDVYLDSNGVARILVDPGASLATDGSFTFPFNQWFSIRQVFDLNNNLCKFYVNGALKYAWAYNGNLGGIDFFAATAWDLNYIDEVSYISLPDIVYNPDLCPTAVDITQYFGFPPDIPQTTGLFDNSNATNSATDPQMSCWNEQPGSPVNTDRSMWFTFSGDGKNYHIETVKCNATNYIGSNLPTIGGSDPDGDTQMAVFTGLCGDLTQVACNDDLSIDGDPDWRAGLDLETQPGVEYLILVDGFNYGNNLIASGQFCLEITRQPDVLCAQGSVGSFELANNGFVCFGTNLASIMTVTELNNYVLPNEGPVNGLCWAVTSVPVPNGVWPPSLGASYLTSTNFVQQLLPVSLANTQALAAPVLLYITPVVVAGAVITTPGTVIGMEDVSVDGGCYFTGPSKQIVLVPDLAPITAFLDVTNPSNQQGNNGFINVAVEGGLYDYVGDPSTFEFEWSNGSTEQDQTGLGAGTYTVTISDISGCVDDLVLSSNLLVNTDDPAVLQTLQLTPNPARDLATLQLSLRQTAAVQIELMNLTGQKVYSAQAGNVQQWSHTLPLTDFPAGPYFLRLFIGGETLVKKLMIQK
jgi:hypothetical protein